ncbi:MAG: YtxH domain-containing protein [Anaerolineae bacterium]
MKKGCVFFLGLALGGAIGWITGVLSAPRSGQETMSALSSKAIELSNIMGFYGVPSEPVTETEVVILDDLPAEDTAVEDSVPTASEEA